MQWTILASAEEVAETACQRILAAARAAIEKRGAFHLVLAGGSTPRRTYELLAEADADWPHWHLYFGDERCLAPDHPERNSMMTERALTSRVPIPEQQIHPIPAELGADLAAEAYARTIAPFLPFDLVLLGMGEDGHTASLFPGQAPAPDALVVAVQNAPKPPPQRVTLSYPALENCHALLFLITGENKRNAIAQWRKGVPIPINQVHPMERGELLIDQAANGVI